MIPVLRALVVTMVVNLSMMSSTNTWLQKGLSVISQFMTHLHQMAAECCNHIHTETVQAILIDSGLPKSLWVEAKLLLVYLYNCVLTCAIDGMTPYEKATGEKPNISELISFGKKIWIKLTPHPSKLSSQVAKVCFVEYDLEAKGYQVYWPHN